jgi:hypothetical protein
LIAVACRSTPVERERPESDSGARVADRMRPSPGCRLKPVRYFCKLGWRFAPSRPKTRPKIKIGWETAVDVQEVRKLDAYLKRLFGNPRIRVAPRPKKDDSAEVYIGDEFIGVLFVDDEDDDRSYQFQMAILEDDLVDQG